ncbi:hypothetical protein NQK81_01545 [Amycolatopsis roodepoortensis]|uniref:hypothetical protein n=1 Tax=Amycolatopsis roodepoortensis TaxID=700274 RepID=UPI00214AD048|nr:hypothetical protein [Amycolatopsis roodepoortensis]UUV32160.1 hypothetical protein NQK81_01545 [Amycolatopsis roodepoortensis]
MPRPDTPGAAVAIELADGSHRNVHVVIADRVVGVDADDDLLIPLGEPGRPILHDDGTEKLIPLTPCCNASGKGSESRTGVVCRRCYREVDAKYGGSSSIAVARQIP